MLVFRVWWLASLLGLLWLVEVVDVFVMDQQLNAYGISPRAEYGLIGVVLAPVLHESLKQLATVTPALAILGSLLVVSGVGYFIKTSLFISVIAGLGIWLFGASGEVYLGAQHLVFGYLAFLSARGLFEWRLWPLIASLTALLLYGGMAQVLLERPLIEGSDHLVVPVCGLAAGLLCAFALVRKRPVLDS